VEAVLSGAKKSTAGLAESDEPSATPGDRFILEDEKGQPRAIVEITGIRVIPASEIDLGFARDEGEGFESVEDWRKAHERFFEQPIEADTLIEAIRFRIVERL
jgi:uncharacterized protein YhfF